MARHRNQMTFQKGNIPWNANRRVSLVCEICQKSFTVPLCRVKNAKNVSCSKACASELTSRRGTAHRVMELRKEGKSAKEIALAVGCSLPTVYSHLNRRQYRFRQKGTSRATVVKDFLRDAACVVCGWTRCLDAAHIIPASKGGTMEILNLVPLCPNHHRLFDTERLTADEKYRIEEWDAQRRMLREVKSA
jgi:hypothetical protein